MDWLPNGKSGPWSIKRFTITKKDADGFNLGMIMNGSGARQVRPGEYVELRHQKRGVIMSNTQAEINDHYEPYSKAEGLCLIHGLGLGMITAACLRKDTVERVTVVERDEDVIKLVAPHITKEWGARFEIVQGNSLDWHPPRGVRYNMVWHDIWDAISCDNKPEMSKLHRRYGKRCEWQGSWGKWEIERMMAEERRSPYYR